MTAQNARLRRCGAALLCLVCAAVMVRSAFVGLEIDEEYALSLGFRLVSGDRLFYSMWEPHQLSSLPSAALLAAFMAVTGGTTGVLLFFRLVVLVCKAAMSYAFYREFRRDLGGRGALLAARLQLILHDPQYDFTTGARLAALTAQAWSVAKSLVWPLAAAALVCALMWALRLRGVGDAALYDKGDALCRVLSLWAALAALQCLVRAVADRSLDERQFVPVLVLAGAAAFRKGRGTPGSAALFWLGYLPGLAAYAMILRSTLLGLAPTFMYLMWPAVCGALAMLNARDKCGAARRAQGAICLAAALAFLLVCRIWCVEVTGWKPASVADTPLVRIENGPAKGICADEKAADMQECLVEALEPYAGQAVLQAIGEQHGLGFLMADGTLTVAQASVISGTDSDPRFEQYYTELPDKQPDVILYDDAEVRDMTEFHEWIEANFTITQRYAVQHGTASLQVLVCG